MAMAMAMQRAERGTTLQAYTQKLRCEEFKACLATALNPNGPAGVVSIWERF